MLEEAEGTVHELDNTPLAHRARGQILDAILDGRFESRLPAEDVLAKMLNVSRTTVRSALQGLEQEGIITRRRAIGTTINRHVGPSTLALQRMIGFDRLLHEKYSDVGVEVSTERCEVPAEFSDVFPAQGECCYMEKAYRAEGSVALYVRDVVPWENLSATELGDDVPASLFDFSKRYCGEPIDHAVVELVPMLRGDGDTALDISKGTPFIRLLETHYTRNAHIVGYSIIDVDDRSIRLEVFRREQG
jgi:GntR family transcriptional regulator